MKNRIKKLDPELSRMRRTAGRKGGLQTLKRHGIGHMKVIGLKGARAFHLRYKLIPIMENDFAIVDRKTNLTKALLSGRGIHG